MNEYPIFRGSPAPPVRVGTITANLEEFSAARLEIPVAAAGPGFGLIAFDWWTWEGQGALMTDAPIEDLRRVSGFREIDPPAPTAEQQLGEDLGDCLARMFGSGEGMREALVADLGEFGKSVLRQAVADYMAELVDWEMVVDQRRLGRFRVARDLVSSDPCAVAGAFKRLLIVAAHPVPGADEIEYVAFGEEFHPVEDGEPPLYRVLIHSEHRPGELAPQLRYEFERVDSAPPSPVKIGEVFLNDKRVDAESNDGETIAAAWAAGEGRPL